MKRREVNVRFIIILLLNIYLFLKGFNISWEWLISREPVEYATEGRNVLKFWHIKY